LEVAEPVTRAALPVGAAPLRVGAGGALFAGSAVRALGRDGKPLALPEGVAPALSAALPLPPTLPLALPVPLREAPALPVGEADGEADGVGGGVREAGAEREPEGEPEGDSERSALPVGEVETEGERE